MNRNMKVTLKVADRIIIPLALRYLANGGYAKFVTAKTIQQKVELSPEELEQIPNVEILSQPYELAFDGEGNLSDFQ